MADWTIAANLPLVARYKGSDTNRLAVTANSSANTKGSWIEAVASTTYRTDFLILKIFANDTNYGDFLIDIGVGANPNEVAIISDLYYGSTTSISRVLGIYYTLPISIPAGTRLCIRCQAQTGSAICYVSVHCFGGGGFSATPYVGKITAYGANAADSGGVEVDPGGSADTKGLYSVITASCEDIRALFIAVGQKGNTARTDGYIHLDVSVGADGSEVVVVPDWSCIFSSGTDTVFPVVSPIFPINISAGSRITARASASITDATDRLVDLIVYGIR